MGLWRVVPEVVAYLTAYSQGKPSYGATVAGNIIFRGCKGTIRLSDNAVKMILFVWQSIDVYVNLFLSSPR
jgi:hypothetical protein